MLATKSIIHVGERPVQCERSFDARLTQTHFFFQSINTFFFLHYIIIRYYISEKLAFQPHQQNFFYETSANEIGKESPNDFDISIKFITSSLFFLASVSCFCVCSDINLSQEFLSSSFRLERPYVFSFFILFPISFHISIYSNQTNGCLNTSTTKARYVDTHTMASDYGY